MILTATNQYKVAFETLYGSLVFQFLHCVSNENVKINGEPSSYNTVAVESASAADLYVHLQDLGGKPWRFW